MRLTSTIAIILAGTTIGIAPMTFADTTTKQGVNASGQTCTVKVTREPDGSISTSGSSGGAGSVSSNSSAGGSSVHVQAGNGSVSSSTSMPSGTGATSTASTVTVNGCTISTTSP